MAETPTTPASDPAPAADPTPTITPPVADPSPVATADASAAPPDPPTPADKLYPDGEAPKEAVETTAEPAEGEKPKEPAADARAVPATAADYKLEIPADMKLDDAALGNFRDFAAKEKLPNEVAQSMLNLHIEAVKAVATGLVAEQQRVATEMINGWKAELDADPDLGGGKRAAALQSIGRALDEYGDANTRKAFDLTGAGWNPSIVKFIAKMSAALSEGSPVLPKGPVGSKGKTPAERLYGSTVN